MDIKPFYELRTRLYLSAAAGCSVFLLPRNDQKLLYLTVTKLLVIMTKTNEKEKEIITAQSFDEQQLIITSFVAKSHGYYNKLRAVCQSRRKNYLSES